MPRPARAALCPAEPSCGAQKSAISQEEKKLIAEIKKAAKEGQEKNARILAKQLVRRRGAGEPNPCGFAVLKKLSGRAKL